MTDREFSELLSDCPALNRARARGGTTIEFRRFREGIARDLCAYSYVIPFVTETHCLVTRRGNGNWVLAGGTLERGETWTEGAHRELLEETGCRIGQLHPIGMYCCRSKEAKPRRPYQPHPESVRVVSWADVERRIGEPCDPDPDSRIVEVRTVHYQEAPGLFGSDTPDFGELYQLAFQVRQRSTSL